MFTLAARPSLGRPAAPAFLLSRLRPYTNAATSMPARVEPTVAGGEER